MNNNPLVFKVNPAGPVLLNVPGGSIDEVSLHLPQGVYTTFRTYRNRTCVVGLSMHLERIAESARGLGYEEIIDFMSIRLALRVVLREPDYTGEARVRLIADITEQAGALYICTQSLPLINPEHYTFGVNVQTSTLIRATPQFKSTNFLGISHSQRSSLPEGIFERLLIDRKGYLLEGMTSNFFAVQGGVLFTAGEGILSGITRQIILEVVRQLGISCQLIPLNVRDIAKMSEAFITSSSRGVVPVIKIDNLLVGNGMPGPITKELSRAYLREVELRAEEI